MATYGVTPQGFVLKRLPDIMAEIEESARGIFGAGVIQTAQSPLGQLNGLCGDMVRKVWEMGLETYQSIDPDQAESINLDRLAKLRLLQRATDELDLTFRQDVTNAGRAHIDIADVARAIRGLTGVTYAQIFINSSSETDSDGLPGHSLAAAVIGGDDDELAQTLRAYVVPGIDTYGNTRVDTVVDGFCRTISLARVAPVRVMLDVSVRVKPDRNGCPPPSPTAIAVGLSADLTARLLNGDDIDEHVVRSTLEARYPNVEFVSAEGSRAPADVAALPLSIGFFEIATVAAADALITVVS